MEYAPHLRGGIAGILATTTLFFNNYAYILLEDMPMFLEDMPILRDVFMNQQQKNQFFSELAIAMNLSHLSTAKQYYYGFVKMISQSLSKDGELKMPDLGIFYMKEYSSKKIGDLHTGGTRVIPESKVLKFKPDYKLNYYVKNK